MDENPYRSPHADAAPNADIPWWVRLCLWGASRRWHIWFWFWFSVALAGGLPLIAILDSRLRILWFGVALLLSALWYWDAIRWMNRHQRWQEWETRGEKSSPPR